jgi:hypothetical protein
MRRRLLKWLSLAIVACVATFATPTQASAYPYQFAWWLKAYGSAQIVVDANHWWSESYDQWGNHQGRGFDFWLDSYCQLTGWSSGDNQGTPIRPYFSAPFGSIQGCIAIQQSVFHGWTDGLGTYSGAFLTNPSLVYVYESYVFPRDGSLTNSRGTTVEIW